MPLQRATGEQQAKLQSQLYSFTPLICSGREKDNWTQHPLWTELQEQAQHGMHIHLYTT